MKINNYNFIPNTYFNAAMKWFQCNYNGCTFVTGDEEELEEHKQLKNHR